jgi:hypothetical protein
LAKLGFLRINHLRCDSGRSEGSCNKQQGQPQNLESICHFGSSFDTLPGIIGEVGLDGVTDLANQLIPGQHNNRRDFEDIAAQGEAEHLG